MTEITAEIRQGDCIDVMKEMDDESVHAVVTDPPYGLAFMGKTWDDFDPKEYQEFCQEWAEEAYRVLKPGGHLLAFSGTRTYHRLGTGIEDAGFEIRDKFDWLYGSGFPRVHDVSKAIDDYLGMERDTKRIPVSEVSNPKSIGGGHGIDGGDRPHMVKAREKGYHEMPDDQPVSDEAKHWDGWKTGLKPAHEPVCVARKPFDMTVAECILTYGTGAYNIEEAKIPADENSDGSDSLDRYPANILLDEEVSDALEKRARVSENLSGVSSYFYTAKPSRSERTHNGEIENKHPTIKPIKLMEYLVKLVTAEGQIVLDPFVGSGTTCLAAYNMGRDSIGIEMDPESVVIARKRIELNMSDPEAIGTEPDHIYNSPADW